MRPASIHATFVQIALFGSPTGPGSELILIRLLVLLSALYLLKLHRRKFLPVQLIVLIYAGIWGNTRPTAHIVSQRSNFSLEEVFVSAYRCGLTPSSTEAMLLHYTCDDLMNHQAYSHSVFSYTAFLNSDTDILHHASSGTFNFNARFRLSAIFKLTSTSFQFLAFKPEPLL